MSVLSRALTRAITAITQNIFTTPHQNWLDTNGKPLAGGMLYVYAAGTSTPVNTWQDEQLSILNTNPVILDAGGFTTVWLNPADTYKFRMVNRIGEQQWTVDNYQAGSLTANILVPLNFIIPATGPNDIFNGSNSQAWRWQLTPGTGYGFAIAEPVGAPSTPGPFSYVGFEPCLFQTDTVPGSTITPFRATTNAGTGLPNGVGIDPVTGNIMAVGSAIFVGPVRIPSLINAASLATDALGNIILGTGGGGGGPGTGGIQSINLNTDPAQTIAAGPGITVTSAGGTTTISLATAPPGIGAISFSPGTVQGGTSSTGTATLTAAAPTGGAIVGLSSSDPAVTIPASVTIAAGTTSATFTATTTPVVTNTTVSVTGSFNGTVTGTLVVTAPPPPPQPIYGGYAPDPNSLGVAVSGANLVLVPSGDILSVLQTTPEQVGSSWNFTPATQCICLVLYGGTRTFRDQNGNNVPTVTPPAAVTVNGNQMYLYSTEFPQSAPITVVVAS